MSDDVLPATPPPPAPVPPPPSGGARLLTAAALLHVAAAAACAPILLERHTPVAGLGILLGLDGLAVVLLGAVAVRQARRGVADAVLTAVLTLAALGPALRAAVTGEPWAGVDLAGALPAALALRSSRAAALTLLAMVGSWAGGSAVGLLHEGLAAPDLRRLGGSVMAGAVLLAVLVAVLVVRENRDESDRRLADALLGAADSAVRDGLTGALNRAGLDLVSAPILENARREGQALYCLYVDVDGFRELNESAGGERADDVLRCLVEALRASIRGTDVVARWAGDEFVVLGPGTGTSPLEMERRVRTHLGSAAALADLSWNPAVSIGSATLVPWDEGDLPSLLRRADQDMQLRRTLRRQRTRRSEPVAPPTWPVAGNAEH